MSSLEQEVIAITGMACRLPGGSNCPSKLWDLLQSPRHLAKRVPADRFDSTGYFHPNGSYHGTTTARDAYFLEEDVTRFDNAFFNILPIEAEALDPQQRLIMETVYDALCAAGQTMETSQGSNTAVYVGLMCDDWSQLVSRDWDLTQTYAAIGQSRAILANRISHFFDWHGPSMTIDTACSSSLVAVHQAVTALRNGECTAAVVAAANLILAPGTSINETKLNMLSPTGSCKMWDAEADGYARGEGIAAIVLKPLRVALEDGDHIDCVIRGTAVNQDGKTTGITMPNSLAQAALIRDAYVRAGLDINHERDRPQFFHAHGTGTAAGDPKEAEAISQCFFRNGRNTTDQLYVGSIKTIIGHTEGAAGLASIIGTSLAMQHGIIPPNLHFNTLSPHVAPFYTHLEVPTSAKPWPCPFAGQPRRASINSFGFGGTNAHVIVESFGQSVSSTTDTTTAASTTQLHTPLTVSAASPSALRAMLADLRSYLESHANTNMRDLAYTLQSRRSTFAFRKAIVCNTTEKAISEIDQLLASDAPDQETSLSYRYADVSAPSILGVFTGQGAQWPRMGAKLIEESPYVSERITELQRALSTLPEGERPDWSLHSELLANSEESRLSEASISQPLCTAIQIVLVDLIRMANIQLCAVIGHSSGEIAAAYAAGFLSANDAIRIAYFRGLFAKLARSPLKKDEHRGSMIAVGMSLEEALDLCRQTEFAGRIQVAAYNSSTSISLSGDADALGDATALLKKRGRFVRLLRVDTAYHSHHMKPCASPYLAALERCNITVGKGNGTIWFSSVLEGLVMSEDDIQSQYWVDNMVGAVLFAPAVAKAASEAGPFHIAIELGPHPALKGPCLDMVEEVIHQRYPYTGLLGREKDDVDELASALGKIWMHLGASSVGFDRFEKEIFPTLHPNQAISDLPTYPFDHSRSFYTLTRLSGSHRNIHAPPHPLLGRRLIEVETSHEVSWRNILRPSENSWLKGHGLQAQSVFPSTGYISMAIEAAVAVAGPDRKPGLISLKNVVFTNPITFSDDKVGMESRVTTNIDHVTGNELLARVTCHSGLPFDSTTPLKLNFSATITIAFYEPKPDTLSTTQVDEVNLLEVKPEHLYTQLTKLGYIYSPPFKGIRAIQHKKGFAMGTIEDDSGNSWEDQLLVHPGWLDSALQTSFAAYSHPHDNRLFTPYVPIAIRSIVINPYLINIKSRGFQYQSTICETYKAPMVVDIDIFEKDVSPSHALIQLESVQWKPLVAISARDDVVLFSRFEYQLAGPDAVAAVAGDELVPSGTATIIQVMERVSFFYLRRLSETITAAEKAAALPHFNHLLEHAGRVVATVKRGDHPVVPREAITDTSAFIELLVAGSQHRADFQMIEAAGMNLVDEIRRSGSMLEHMMKDGLLDRFYGDLAGLDTANIWIARIVAQIAHRYPHLRIFEIGAGTGSATNTILSTLGDAFATYMYTDISAGFFSRAQERFRDFATRMEFSTYDMEIPPKDQGFEEGTYDVVLASNVLHATANIDDAVANARRLLRPGGYLIALEIVNKGYVTMSVIAGGLPGWWAAAAVDPRRRDGPCLNLSEWDALVREHGFSGVDMHTPVEHKLQSFSVFACQAIDNRVNILREPLKAPSALTFKTSQNLVVVGGSTAVVRRLAEHICALLIPYYTKIDRVDSLHDLNAHNTAQSSSVLCLTELDQQFLEDRNAPKLEALKTLWRYSTILWVMRGARAKRPYSSMLIGLCRVVHLENPDINLQVLDFDDDNEPSPQTISEALVRLEIARDWKADDSIDDLLWSVEPELHYVDGKLLIPRLYPSRDANKRYNAWRRAVFEELNPRETTVVLKPTADETAFELSSVSPLRMLPPSQMVGKQTVTLRVEKSLLQAVKIHEEGFFALCAGVDVETGDQFIALVSDAVQSQLQVPVEYAVPLPPAFSGGGTGTAIGAVAAHLLAQSILAAAPHFGTVLVHEADGCLRDALVREAPKKGVRVNFTVTEKEPEQTRTNGTTPSCTVIHDKLPVRLAQRLVPRDVSLLVDLSPPASAGAEVIALSVPPHTACITAADFVRMQPEVFPATDVQRISGALKAAWQAVKNQRQESPECSYSIPVVSLEDVANHSAVAHSELSIVDWNTSSVRALVRPIDADTIFRADGTYLLIGASQISQSLATWMVANGARHIVLGDEQPNVDPRYIESLNAKGATVRVMAVDIANPESLCACYNTISTEMPLVIGVTNGVMERSESDKFDDLEYTSMEEKILPKVRGSVLLDGLFHHASLDFFILFTSFTSIVGSTGQSSYLMANHFMAGLAAQRRDIRGVAGSSMAIGLVQGLDYIERTTNNSNNNMGFRDMSEQDLHQHFAEAMLVGRPNSRDSSEIVAGLSPFLDGPSINTQLRTDPRFGHLKLQVASGQNQVGGDRDRGFNAADKATPLRDRLAAAKSCVDALAAVRNEFIDRLKRIFLMQQNDAFREDTTFVELGLDSIIAVDIRVWLLQELDVDMPVLVILEDGLTIKTLLQRTMELIPKAILDYKRLA